MTTTLAPDHSTLIAAGRPSLHPGRPKGEHQRLLLMALVEADPGIHIMRVAHLLGLNWNTCHHHARRLATEGRIVMRKVQGRLCLFDRREGAVSARIAPLLLRDPRTADLVRLILATPGVNQKTLAHSLGIAPSAVHRHVLRLERAGLIQRVHHAREMAAYASEGLAAAWTAAGHGSPLMPAPVGGQMLPSAPATAFLSEILPSGSGLLPA